MTTIIDKLAIEIGIENKKLKEGLKVVNQEFDKTGKLVDKNQKANKKAQNENEKTTSRRVKDLKSENKELDAMGKTLVGIGKGVLAYASVTKAITIAKTLGSDAAAMERLSVSMNAAPSAMKKYSNMLKAVGGNGEDALNVMKGLHTSISNLAMGKGVDEKIQALSMLGVSITGDDGKRRSDAELIEDIREKSNKFEDNRRIALLEQLGIGSDMQFLMKKPNAEWQKLANDAEVLSTGFDKNAENMQKANEAIGEFANKLDMIGTQILGKFVASPVAQKLLEWAELVPKEGGLSKFDKAIEGSKDFTNTLLGNDPDSGKKTRHLIEKVTNKAKDLTNDYVENVAERNKKFRNKEGVKKLVDSETATNARMALLSPSILYHANKWELPFSGMMAQIRRESRGKPNAVSPAGAAGVAQLMPATAKEEGVNPLDVSPSINAMGHIMAKNMKKYRDYKKALAAYNWGGGNLDKSIKKHGANWLDYAPKETRDYVNALSPIYQGEQQSQKPETQIHVDNVTINTQSNDPKAVKREFSGKMSALAEGGMR
jgi:hypothetical protein